MGLILGAVIFILAIVAGSRTVKLGIRSVNAVFDLLEKQFDKLF